MDWLPWVLILAIAVQYILGVRIVSEYERLAVQRLGRFHRVLTPGFHWILPGIDRPIRVDLNISIPDWQSLSEPEIQAKLQELAVSGQIRDSVK